MVSQKKNVSCDVQKHWRDCPSFLANIRYRRRAVRPPKKAAKTLGRRKEIAEKNEKSGKLLRIDMDWGIRIPRTPMETTAEVDAPTHLRRVRRDFFVAIFDEKRPHWGYAMVRFQRENPM